ncbi:Alpha/Beta hydrolase protein [Lentinula boryana]|uniref:Alpha/Beta hydrolase protein n=1 Tax=Lentinula boryana TaxID=40481 RepID=A0ABQ8Q4P7_9AGAR|nr:Alpha/Beta hydrolase protein [Lentinula boryana]
MLYDKTPQYPHFAHLPFAKEPFKAIYVFQRIITTVLLVPIWILANLPRSRRPRQSWSLRQIIFVNFTRRIYRVTEVAGVTWGTRNPEEEPGPKELKETVFEWAPPLKESLRKGVVLDRFGRVPFKPAGCFVWRREARNKNQIPVIGIFFHGGGYSQLSAHEKSRTSHIPRRLMKNNLFTEIYAVEYRLLQHAPLPAVIMDAAAAYSHIVDKYYGSDFASRLTNQPASKPCKIILLGDSSGGNLALALARWIRDEQVLPTPDGLLLFSPSCDASHAFPSTDSSYIPRPHASTDYLTDTPEPRALMQRTFLGFKYRPGGTGWGQWKQYVSPASPRVLRRWGHIVDLYDGSRLGDPSPKADSSPVEPPSKMRVWLTPNIAGDQFDWETTARTDNQNNNSQSPGDTTNNNDSSAYPPPSSDRTSSAIPEIKQVDFAYPQFHTLFAQFPKTFILIGDAERLTTEVGNLARAMGKDWSVQVRWIPDAVHDVFMIPPGWWDERIKSEVWEDVKVWMRGFHEQ